ncbi:MAG: ornithine cyclodeaminase family protein [Planctomycetaceae bacterium]
MSLLFIRETEARSLISMAQAIDAVENVFRSLSSGESQNIPRQRVRIPGVMLHSLSAAVSPLGYVGWKNYTTTRTQARFHIALYNPDGEWVSLLEADWLGQLRTGAASGVATRLIAKEDAQHVAIFGSGKQARTQLQAVCAVRNIQHATVFSNTPERREEFARTMSDETGIQVVAADSPAECVAQAEIICTATTSKEPVVTAEMLRAGVHINAVGSNALNRAELSADCFTRIDKVVCDDVDSCRNEAGDFVGPMASGSLQWEKISPLASLVTKSEGARTNREEITLFKSVGMAIEDIAVAAIVYEAAREANIGTELEI